MTRLLLLAALAFCISGRAYGHDWYEPACCGGVDCHPVDDEFVRETDHGVEVRGFGTVSETDPRLRWSQDEHDHICSSVGFDNNRYTPKLLCVYRKRKFM